MKQIELAIADYLNTLAAAHGNDHVSKTIIRHVGGTNIGIQTPNGSKRIVDIGQLRLMTSYLQKGFVRKAA